MKKIELHIDDLSNFHIAVDGDLVFCIPPEPTVSGTFEATVFHDNQIVFSVQCVNTFLGVSYIYPMFNPTLSKTVFDLYCAIKNEEDGDGC